MRIATSQLFERPASLMASLTQKADALQTRISTGKKLLAPSDDAGAYVQLRSLARADANGASYAANVKLAQGVLAQADGTLDGIGTQLQQAQELALQASNGTLSAANRVAIGATLGAVMDELLALANTVDTRGQPLFGGANGGPAYVEAPDGTVSFAGTGEASPIPVGDHDSVVTTVRGDRLFGDMFATIKALSDALSAGGTVPAGTLDKLGTATESVAAARASVGARAVRVDMVAERLSDTQLIRNETRQGIEAADITTTVTELQQTLTILQATQASFTKLSSLSLFDYLR
ncbi:MAG: flagellin [Pseudomonadota bacterium]